MHVPIVWQSLRIKRVVKSYQASETLAIVDAMEVFIFYREQLLELIGIEDIPNNIPIICKTDNKALYESAYSSTQKPDKSL